MSLSSTDAAPPNPAPNGDGRQTDFIIANLHLKSLAFNSPIALMQDANTTIPTPQFTWDQNGNLTTSYPVAFVRGVTPTFTLDLYPITGSATMGFTLDMSASPNTGDAAVTLYNTGTFPPEAFTPPATRTAQAALYNKVAIYTNTISSLELFVKFTLPAVWKVVQVYQNASDTTYGVLATPTAPMAQPWTGVLYDCCTWAKGDTDAATATTDLAKNEYANSHYNGGTPTCTTETSQTAENFYLLDWLNGAPLRHLSMETGQCTEISDFLVCLSNALGAKALVSLRSNLDTSGAEGFQTNPITVAPDPTNDAKQINWSFHQITQSGNDWDGCLRFNNQVTPANLADGTYSQDLINTPLASWVPVTIAITVLNSE